MNTNDKKIKQLLQVIETKIEALGECPKISLKTNGIYKNGMLSVNVNCATIEQLVDVACFMLLRNNARKILDVEQLSEYDDWIDDCKQRIKQLKWKEEKSKLDQKKNELNNYMSEEVKTANFLSEFEKDL